ncbi:class I SAM-dependent methyltransferase [Pseudomonas sp. C9-3]|uniref:class I SAM-dependent methyltransferase n=1 Tax=Pseudomonas sp. C9-3 TaxID=3078264 RepID=UPI0028E58F38|nr:class I SAM-dependent methyltransferase [Pseudomonas sp. C9-3]
MTSIELETPDCPLCGSPERRPLYDGPGDGPYAVCACVACGMAFLSPRATEREMLLLYQRDRYFAGGEDEGYSNYSNQEVPLRRTFRRLLECMDKGGRTGGRLLEIGCGYGYFLDEAKPYFARRVGTDYSSEAVANSRRFADFVIQGGADDVGDEEKFDCIVAIHVVEHVYDPRKFVQSLLEKLNSGGSLILAAPDFGSYWRKLMGNRWPSFKFPEHVQYFSSETLSRLMGECGLEGLEGIPYPHAFPLPLIASKFGLKLPAVFDRFNLWLPSTTVAYVGTKNG